MFFVANCIKVLVVCLILFAFRVQIEMSNAIFAKNTELQSTEPTALILFKVLCIPRWQI